MKHSRCLAMLAAGGVAAFSMLSCSGEVPSDPDVGLTQSELLAAANPALHSVTGQGTSWYERGANAGWWIIALNARQMPDGSAQGNFHWQTRSREWGGRALVKVSCLTISGNEARMVGQLSQAGNPANVGKWAGLYVKDNGEGQAAPADQIFHRWFGPFEEEALLFCAGPRPEDPVPRDIVAGNIQVR